MVIFIEGNIEKEQKITTIGTVIYYNFMNSTELEQALTKVRLLLLVIRPLWIWLN
jgi:hypothetical protein